MAFIPVLDSSMDMFGSSRVITTGSTSSLNKAGTGAKKPAQRSQSTSAARQGQRRGSNPPQTPQASSQIRMQTRRSHSSFSTSAPSSIAPSSSVGVMHAPNIASSNSSSRNAITSTTHAAGGGARYNPLPPRISTSGLAARNRSVSNRDTSEFTVEERNAIYRNMQRQQRGSDHVDAGADGDILKPRNRSDADNHSVLSCVIQEEDESEEMWDQVDENGLPLKGVQGGMRSRANSKASRRNTGESKSKFNGEVPSPRHQTNTSQASNGKNLSTETEKIAGSGVIPLSAISHGQTAAGSKPNMVVTATNQSSTFISRFCWCCSKQSS